MLRDACILLRVCMYNAFLAKLSAVRPNGTRAQINPCVPKETNRLKTRDGIGRYANSPKSVTVTRLRDISLFLFLSLGIAARAAYSSKKLYGHFLFPSRRAMALNGDVAPCQNSFRDRPACPRPLARSLGQSSDFSSQIITVKLARLALAADFSRVKDEDEKLEWHTRHAGGDEAEKSCQSNQ